MIWKKPTPSELASDWIASRRADTDDAAAARADWLLLDFPDREPELTWETIKLVLQAYPEADFYSQRATEAQKVCGVLAAGPVEDLLSFHGATFIDRFEAAAAEDRRMAWALGGTWQFQMTDEIWKRVQGAADHSYWDRPVATNQSQP